MASLTTISMTVGGKELMLPADEAIRYILRTMLRDDPSDGDAYRMIGGILHATGHPYEAQVCCAGSLIQAIGADMVELPGIRERSVDEAVADDEPIRKVTIGIEEALERYRPSRSFDGSCPPVLGDRPVLRRPCFVTAIPQGRVVVGNVGYAVFTGTGTYLRDFCGNDGRVVAAGDPAKRPPLRRIAGTVLALTNAYANGNFHWMFETLPRIMLARAAGYDMPSIDHILVRPLLPYQIEALRLLGVPTEKLLFTYEYPHIVADRLIAVSSLETYDHRFHPPSIEIEGWICRFLATAFGFAPVDRATADKRIHISRKKAAWRNVINQEDVNAFLEKNGFRTVYFEDLSLPEKHRVLNGADIVTGLFGAGFAHLPFCRPGTKAVLFYPEDCITDSYWTVCNHMGIEHFHVVCDSARRFFPTSQQGRNYATVDALVDLDRLKRTLQAAGLDDVLDL